MSSSNKKCPHSARMKKKNLDWWPNKLDLKVLQQASAPLMPSSSSSFSLLSDYDKHLNEYVKKFESLDLNALKRDVIECMTTSQDWWPADYGHYGPLMIRLAWHSAGTYRIYDGRGGSNGGNIRLAPLNSWPDNGNLDKAKRLLWPIKQKYNHQISWGDLIIFAGNCALESMGIIAGGGSIPFSGGRLDIYQPEEDIYWGPEETWLDDKRHNKAPSDTTTTTTTLDEPLGAVQMGLIYVNPEGPNGNSNAILESAKDIRDTFYRMGMNDTETVALIAGGHTFGKAHGAADPKKYVGPEPEGASIEQQGLGWKNTFGTGKGKDTITSGLEGAWTTNPTRWDNGYFHILFHYKHWKQTKSPAGATQWIPDTSKDDIPMVPDAHDPTRQHLPIMFTTDLALKYDPAYCKISKQFYENHKYFEQEFIKAWFKLTHRDLGPTTRYLGKYVPTQQYTWQDPLPTTNQPPLLLNPHGNQIQFIKQSIIQLIQQGKVSIASLVTTAWASACTYRVTDHRGGANGGRIRLLPQNKWKVNHPQELQSVLSTLETIQQGAKRNRNISITMADLIVLAGNVAIEQAIKKNTTIKSTTSASIPFYPGRVDVTQQETDVDSFRVLEPRMDGFRNYVGENNNNIPQELLEELFLDHGYKLTLSLFELVVLVGGLRVLNANTHKESKMGVFTNQPETLSNDFFLNLLDPNTVWNPKSGTQYYYYEGRDYRTKQVKWMGSSIDLLLGSNSQMRAVCELYGSPNTNETFVQEFVKAWSKVMNLDRFDLKINSQSNQKKMMMKNTTQSKL